MSEMLIMFMLRLTNKHKSHFCGQPHLFLYNLGKCAFLLLHKGVSAELQHNIRANDSSHQIKIL